MGGMTMSMNTPAALPNMDTSFRGDAQFMRKAMLNTQGKARSLAGQVSNTVTA